jgi:hypothetical protein
MMLMAALEHQVKVTQAGLAPAQAEIILLAEEEAQVLSVNLHQALQI